MASFFYALQKSASDEFLYARTPLSTIHEVVDEDTQEAQPMDDETFSKRHELYELKERYATLFKKLEKEKKEKLKLQQLSTNTESEAATSPSLASTLNSKNLESLCLEEFKQLVAKLEQERDKRMIGGTSSGCQFLSASMPGSVLSAHLNVNGRQTHAKMSKSANGFDENNNNTLVEGSVAYVAPTHENLHCKSKLGLWMICGTVMS